jgi:hypothetical protein
MVVKIVTEKVHPDEPCHGYFCGPKGGRMIEQVFVIRGDAIACFEQDFGPEEEFLYVPPMMMPSYGENPVGLMQEFGERHRNDGRWAKYIRELKEGSTLFEDVRDQLEQKTYWNRAKSSFGPGGSFQRNRT